MSVAIRISFLLLAATLVNACATTPSEDSDFAIYGEEPEGAGVFSGEDGEIVFFGDKSSTIRTLAIHRR